MLVTSLCCCLVVLGLATPGARAAFGDNMDHGRDDLFEKMGKATVDVFDIVDGQVQLDVALEDTIGQDEVWILDFQPFQHNNKSNRPVIQENGGSLVAENTGTCSNVFTTLPFDSSTGFYKDSYTPNYPGTKSLFSYYETGSEIIQQGDMRIREDHITFMGSMDTLFNCKDSDEETVWEKEVTADAIQFNATLYMTNVRPQGSGTNPEPAYVQSFAILYWRLLRVALSRFLVSSTERLQPIFEFAIVEAVYLNDDEEYGFDRSRAEVQIAFRTVTDNTNGELISVYKINTLVYDPADSVISEISHVKRTPSSGCDKPLGVEDSNIIGDGLITASSYWLEGNSLEYSPDKGRLNAKAVETISAGMWMAGSTVDQWIQVDLPSDNLWVSGVMTQGFGNEDINMWVREFYVGYQVGVGTFNPVLNSAGATHTFTGNYDSHTIVTNYLDAPVSTDAIRIYPTDFENNMALRFELLVCEGHPECFTDANGTDYRGTVHQTVSGTTCQRWSSQEPHMHSFSLENDRDNGIGDHNFCRNPDSQTQPWCYTLDPLSPMEFCDVGAAAVSCAPITAPEADPELYVTYYAPYCNFTEWEQSCTQSWLFVVVLEVDTTAAVNRMPIDATGEFTFEFETYTCPNNDRSACSKVDVPNAIISHEITLQTTVEIVDDVKDSPRIYLKKVHGEDPTVDIRDGYRPGVSHLETVTVDTHFFPEFLRTNLQLELTLFMVCIGREFRDTPDGCLGAPVEQSYTAYVSPEFLYRLSTDNSLLTPDSIATSSQSLESHDYIHSEEIHRSLFVNKALSAMSREYTITNVFRLVERTDRTKRDIQRRDVKDKINDPIAVHQAIYFKGCPPNSTHVAKVYACVCDNKGEMYSETNFKCERSTKGIVYEEGVPSDDAENPQDGGDSKEEEDKEGSGSTAVSSTTILFVGLTILLAVAL
ncbi:uncharacterized protein [Asterias amurensis]|uniref:uncharacterized protein n=1 Tax=Asterias amurensis TaxID=7602 RepID=UPI003AB6A00F